MVSVRWGRMGWRGQSVLVQCGREPADGAQHCFLAGERPVKEFLVEVRAVGLETDVVTAVEEQTARRPDVQVTHRAGRTDAQAAQHRGIVERTLGLGGAQRAVDQAVDDVRTAESLDDEGAAVQPDEAQFVAPAVDDRPFAGCEAVGQGVHELRQVGEVGVENQGGRMEEGHEGENFPMG